MRDWFKDRRTEDENPTIVEEKKSELFLSNGNTKVNIKQEPFLELDEVTAPSNIEKVASAVDAEVVKVKKEPVEEEGEEVEGSVSAVLRSKVRFFFNVSNSFFSSQKRHFAVFMFSFRQHFLLPSPRRLRMQANQWRMRRLRRIR